MNNYEEAYNRLQKRSLESSLAVAIRRKPDEEAKLQELSRLTGLPVEAIRQTPAETEYLARQRQIDTDRIARDSKVLGAWLVNPKNADIAHDDIEQLGAIERWAKGITWGVATGATAGVGSQIMDTFSAAADFNEQLFGPAWKALTGNEETIYASIGDKLRERSALANQAMDQLGPQPVSDTQRSVFSGARSAGTALAMLPMGVGQKATTAAKAISGGMAALTGGTSYAEARRQGEDFESALNYGARDAAVEYWTEMFSVVPLLKLFPGATLKTAAEFAIKEIGGEQAATLLQDLNRWLTLNPDKSPDEFIDERLPAAKDTLISTLTMIAIQGGAVRTAGAVAGVIDRKKQDKERAKQGADKVAEAFQRAAAAKLRERAPGTFKDLAERMTQDADGQPATMFVDAEVLNQSARQMPPEEFDRILPGVRVQLPDALARDGMIEIPVAQAMTTVPGTALEEVLVNNARETPDSPSLAETQEGDKLAEEMLKDAANQAMEQAEDKAAWEASADAVYEDVLGQLEKAGRFSTDVNTAYASLWRAFFSTLAHRAKSTPEEMYRKYAATVQARGVPGAGDMTQPVAKDLDARIDEMVDERNRLQDERGDAGVHDPLISSLSAVTSPAIDIDALIKAVEWARENGREDIVRAAVERAERFAQRSTEQRPGVSADSPKYAEILSKLREIADEAAADARRVRDAAGDMAPQPADPNDPSVLNQAAKVATGRQLFEDIVSNVGLTDDEVDATVIEYMTGLGGEYDFLPPHVGGLTAAVRFLQERRMASGLPKLDISNAADRETLAKLMAAEALVTIRGHGTALEWYDQTIRATLSQLAVKYPELKTDPVARNMMLVAMAVSSQNMNVEDNIVFAESQYEGWRNTGRFPEKGTGKSSSQMRGNFVKINAMAAEHGGNPAGYEWLGKFMATPFLVRELDEAGYKISGENKDTLVFGSAILGPKIGQGFYTNLSGNFDPVTMDMWFMRTAGRLAGTLMDPPEGKLAEQIRKFREALSSTGDNGLYGSQFDAGKIKDAMEDNIAAMALAEEVRKAHERDFIKNRADYDSGAKIKTALVKAAESINKTTKKPKDAPTSGGERNYLREVTQRAVDIASAQYGAPIKPAAFQALIWYPEQELYSALGVRLRVTSQDYSGAAKKILSSQGVDEAALDEAAKDTENPMATRGHPLTEAEKDNWLAEKDRAKYPDAASVILEVAPNPDDAQATADWNQLPDQTKSEISRRILHDLVPRVLRRLGAQGNVFGQIGSYEELTNPSFAIRLRKGDPALVARTLGHILQQKGMMVVNTAPFDGSFAGHAIHVAVGDLDLDQIDGLYQRLHRLEINGQRFINGQTTVAGDMVVLLPEGVDAEAALAVIDSELGGEFQAEWEEIHAAFPEESDYGFGPEQADLEGAVPKSLRKWADSARAETLSERQRLVRESLDQSAGAAPSAEGLSQGGNDPRATYNPEHLLITLLEKADLTSFLHESAHFFLDVMADVASQPDAPAGVAEDMAEVMKWFGVKDLETWRQMPLKGEGGKESHHERFAESFEEYLWTGKAPSLELQPFFRRFASWMVATYRNLKAFFTVNQNAKLSPEISRVFDRLLATEDAIAEAERAAGMVPDDDATNEALEALRAKSLRDLRWTVKARSKAMREAQRAAAEARAAVEAEVKAEVEASPIEQARAWLKENRRTTPEYRDALQRWQEQREAVKERASDRMRQEILDSPDAKDLKPIQRAGLVHQARREIANRAEAEALAWERENPRPKPDIPDLNLDMVAEQFGFAGGAEMMDELGKAPPAKVVIEQMTDQRMLERHGDISSPEALAAAADAAIHNESRRRALASELKAQMGAMNQRQATGETRQVQVRVGKKGEQKVETRTVAVTVNALVVAAKAYAARFTAKQRVGDLKRATQSAKASEAKAAQAWLAATKKGKTAEAIQAKRNQLLNHTTTGALLEAQAEVEKVLRYLKKFDKPGVRQKIAPDYLAQIDALLERYDLRKSTSMDQAERRQALAEWIVEQQDLGFDPQVPDFVMAEAKTRSYKVLTVEEFRGLSDAVKSIEHIGRASQRVLTAQKEMALADAAGRLAQAVADSVGGEEIVTEREPERGLMKWAKGFLISHRKFGSLARQFDGGDTGPWWEILIRPMQERAADEQARQAKFVESYGALLKPIEALPGGMTGERRSVRTLGGARLSRGGRIALMLNWGNEGNRDRMRQFDGMSEATIEEIAAQMTPEELRFVNQVWELVDSFWPEVAAKQARVVGVAPEKVEADPFTATARDGTVVPMRGGYYPIKADPERSDKAQAQDAALLGKEIMRGAFTRSTTRHGHVEARAKMGAGPVLLDPNVVASHAHQVIHDLVWHEWLLDANRLLRHPILTEAIRKHYGPRMLKELTDTIPAIAVGEIVNMDEAHKGAMVLRNNISRSVMGFSATTAMLQPFGILQSVQRIGVGPVMRGIGEMLGDVARVESTARKIAEKSDYMRLRGQTMNREIYEISNRLKGKSKASEIFDASLFLAMRKLQTLADMPTWLGQHEKVLEETGDEAEAIAQADRAVREAQSGGHTTDLSSVQRKHPFLTMFYSYFNATWNLMAESTAKTDFKNPRAVAGWLSDMVLLSVIPAMGPALIMALLRGDDDEPDELAKKLAQAEASYLLGMLVYVRELSGVALGYDYSGLPVTRIAKDIGDVVTQTSQGEIDDALVLAYMRLLGSALGIPTTQMARSYRGWKAWDEGDAPPTAILFGPPQE